MKVFGSLVRLLKEFFTPMLQPPHPSGWWKRPQTKLQRDGMMGPFSKVFYFGSKSWIQKKSCNPDRGTDGSLLPLRATCVLFWRPCFVTIGLDYPDFWTAFAEVTTASLQMSRDLGLKGRAREVDSKQLCVFFKTRKIPDKGKVKIQKSQKIAKTSAWNC